MAAAIAAWMAVSLATSHCTPSPPSSAAVACASAPSRSATTMPVAPRVRNSRHTARPMPRPAPVTKAILPATCIARPSSRQEARQFELRDVITMHCVWAISDPQRACHGVRPAETEIVADARAAEELDRLVDDLAGDVGRDHLDHRDLLLCGLVAGNVHLPRRVQREQPCLVDLQARIRDAFAPDTLLRQFLVECGPPQRAPAHQVECPLSEPDQSHAVMDAARAEPTLRDLEAAAFAQQEVRGRHADIG